MVLAVEIPYGAPKVLDFLNGFLQWNWALNRVSGEKKKTLAVDTCQSS